MTGLASAPGAVGTIHTWAAKNRCSNVGDFSKPAFDLDSSIEGPETIPVSFHACEANAESELWTMHLGGHRPAFNSTWAGALFDFLVAWPRP